jgi:hypothetical protein
VTAAVAGAVVRTGGTRAVASRGGGKVVDGKVTSITDAKPAAKPSAGSGAKGFAAGQAASDLLSMPKGGKGSRALPNSQARRVLVAEFTLCMVILAFAPLTKKDEAPAAFMKRASAIMGLFLILALLSTAGRGASRAAAGFGGLVTLGLLISSRSVFTLLAKKIGTTAGEGADDDAHVEEGDAGESVGGAAGDGAEGAVDIIQGIPFPGRVIGGAGMR